jgi:hypothetical protein
MTTRIREQSEQGSDPITGDPLEHRQGLSKRLKPACGEPAYQVFGTGRGRPGKPADLQIGPLFFRSGRCFTFPGEVLNGSSPTGSRASGKSTDGTAGCPLSPEALGTDYGEAKRRCDEVLNPQFRSWRTGGEVGEAPRRNEVGSFDWMAATFKQSPQYSNLDSSMWRGYDAKLALRS